MVKSAFTTVVLALCLIVFSKTVLAEQTSDTTTVKRIRIASEPDYPPYCMINKEGKAEGFAIDLFLAAAKSVQLEADIKIGIWERIRKDLEEGRIDALPLVGRTPEREPLYDFTFPYLSLHGAIFVRKGSDIKTKEDLAGKEILVMKGDNSEEYARRINITDKIITKNTFKEAFIELANGDHDAIITQQIIGLNLLEKLELTNVEPLEGTLTDLRQDFCFAVREGNDSLLTLLSEGLSIIIANGTYDEIHLKWFGPALKEEIGWRDILMIFLYFVVPVIGIFSIIAILILRRRVRISTASLVTEIEEHKRTVESLDKQQKFLEEMERVSKVGGWTLDVETEKITWTQGTFAIHGLRATDLDPADVKTSLKFYHPEDMPILEKAFQRTITDGEPYILRLRFRSADGIEKWVSTEGRAEFRDGKVFRLYGNIIDITDQKKIEEEITALKDDLEEKVRERTAELNDKVEKLAKSQKAMLYMVEDLNSITGALNEERRKLEISNKELEAFSYSVSHDLRAPLRGVTGFARILSDEYSDKLDDEGKELIRDIQQNTKNMAQLIDDLLQFSRLSRREISKQELDMQGLFKAIGEEIKSREKGKPIDFIAGEIPNAQGDYSLIKQVVINLLSNAAKFSGKKERIIINVTGEKKQGECIYKVSDNGAGFDMKYVEKLFGVFQRLHLAEDYEGTGVGLAIVHRIIERHGGRVWAKSEEGKGATFYFALPT
ncbi:MAG: transporter substrate-binding domain-containing protein [Ignavibacteriaceae bacterium]